MDILREEYSTLIRVMISDKATMYEVVASYQEEGWEFMNHTYGQHPKHGKVSYLLFSRESNQENIDNEP